MQPDLPSPTESPFKVALTSANFEALLTVESFQRPVVIDFIVSKDSMVWPMVPQGVGNSQVQYARDHAPEWDEE